METNTQSDSHPAQMSANHLCNYLLKNKHFCTDLFSCTVYATLTKVRLLICKLTVHGVVGKRYGGVVDVSRAAGEV